MLVELRLVRSFHLAAAATDPQATIPSVIEIDTHSAVFDCCPTLFGERVHGEIDVGVLFGRREGDHGFAQAGRGGVVRHDHGVRAVAETVCCDAGKCNHVIAAQLGLKMGYAALVLIQKIQRGGLGADGGFVKGEARVGTRAVL